MMPVQTYYANADVSAELGLTVFPHRVYVSVLNSEFEIISIKYTLIDGKATYSITAFTTHR